MAEKFEFEIIKHIATLSTETNGWQKEFNLISWNKGKPKYDIRSWSGDRQKMGKGVTLTEEEVKALRDVLLTLDGRTD